MTRERRSPQSEDGHRGLTQGTTGMLLVAAGPDTDTDANEVAAAVRDALRTTDAVLAREDAGITSVLLRGLRPGSDDAAIVEHRVRETCEHAIGPVSTGLAVAASAAEPLDLLLRRAHESLAADAPPLTAGSPPR